MADRSDLMRRVTIAGIPGRDRSNRCSDCRSFRLSGYYPATASASVEYIDETGARVVLNQVHDEGHPQQVLDEIQHEGGQATFV